MAENEAMSVLHAALDDRRVIDVPGLNRLPLHPSTRFIATMNYGYAGTRELNEALVSRFAVIQMPMISQDNLNNKSFDPYEQTLIRDTIHARIPKKADASVMFS